VRIRSTKPEFWRSERVASVSWDARLVLKGLESYVDDNGVGKDDLALIVGDLFQRDLVREPSRTLARVSEAISELAGAGLLWRYEANGTRLFYISFWESIQRVDKAQDGRFPRPDGTMNYKESEIRESVANIREPSRALAPGTGEQGNRGTGEQGKNSPPIEPEADDTDSEPEPDPFDDFWAAYPRKTGKPSARKAWARAIKTASPGVIMAGLERYRFKPEVEFQPHPSTWLNDERWTTNEPPPNVHPIRPGVGAAQFGGRVKWVKATERSPWSQASADQVCTGMFKIQYLPPGEQPA
jgi:hypothetical protein